MTPEFQSVLDRLDEVERRNRGQRTFTLFAVLLSVGVLAFFIVRARTLLPTPAAPPVAAQTPGVVEGTRFLLRGPDGTVRGGMEVERDGTVKLAIGNQDGRTGAAVILAQPTGLVQLQLRSPSGVVRTALNGGIEPSLLLTSDDGSSSAALVTKNGSPGQLFLSDRSGTLRRAP
jgi:hypothetical protein